MPRYGSATLTGIYPGVDIRYVASPSGELTLQLLLQPGADLRQAVFDLPLAFELEIGGLSNLAIRFSPSRMDESLFFRAPTATQGSSHGQPALNYSGERNLACAGMALIQACRSR